MSGYFLLEKRLVCHVLPKDKVHELMFAKPKRVPTKAEKQKKARSEVNNKQRSVDAMKGITAKLVKREEMKRKKLAELGIEYDFPGYAAGAAESMNTNEKNSTSSKKKKRKLSEDGDDKVEEMGDATKMPKSSSKKKKKSKKESVEEEKENDDDVLNEEQDVVQPKSAAKKKKKSKTPKKTPKKA